MFGSGGMSFAEIYKTNYLYFSYESIQLEGNRSMMRETVIRTYLFFFKIMFTCFRILPLQEKAVFVVSFGDNADFTAAALNTYAPHVEIVILRAPGCRMEFPEYKNSRSLEFNISHPLQWLKSICHLATARTVFVDNYFGFLAAARFRAGVRCIQLWHAAGAIKRFGLRDPSTAERSEAAHKRFRMVYQAFTHVVTGSEKMAGIFTESFGLPDSRLLRTGIPRTDFFFDNRALAATRSRLEEIYPILGNRKAILYAPTYRDDALHLTELALDLDLLQQKLGETYILLLRLHPAVRASISGITSDSVLDVSDYPDVNHLLAISDILVTDYSSIPFEFALLNRPMIFYAYDLESYQSMRGFWEDYETLVPGPVVRNTAELIQAIHDGPFDQVRTRQFSDDWNTYSRGNSSQNLIDSLYKSDQPAK